MEFLLRVFSLARYENELSKGNSISARSHVSIILYVLLTLRYSVKLIKKCLRKGFYVRYPGLTESKKIGSLFYSIFQL